MGSTIATLIDSASFDAVVVTSGWIVAWLLLWRLRPWGEAEDGDLEAVSVIIPARNEEHDIPGTLRSLTAQRRSAGVILVVDDHSTDGTALTVDAFEGADLVVSDPLPDGWTGKCWACWQGAKATAGDVLVFVDADVILGPEALERGVAEQRRRGGLVSVQPMHHIDSVVEMLSLPFNVVAMMGIGIGSIFPPRRSRAAAGPFMVCRRDDYEFVGGHRAVRGEVVEDLALAQRFADADLPVSCLGGIDEVRSRMYPGGLREIVTGWSKNFASGARFTPFLRALAIAWWITASLIAAWWITEAVVLGRGELIRAGVLYVAFGVQYAVLGHRVGRFGVAAAAWPLLIAFFTLVFAWSMVATFVLRRVRWSDRDIPLGRSGRRPARPR
jgi:4,4'-diaponeurosporenoate glycosyltransferase